jgi:hypothetical protein
MLTYPMQRREKQKKAARDLVRARTLARGVTRNGTENGESGLAAVLVRREGAQLKNLSRLSHLSRATTPCDGHVRPGKKDAVELILPENQCTDRPTGRFCRVCRVCRATARRDRLMRQLAGSVSAE